MVEDIIKKENGHIIDLKYDKENYNIEYVKNKNLIILRRLLDNQILEIFSDKIGFIVQCNLGEQTNFLVTDYSEEDRNGITLLKFKHYVDKSYLDSLHLVKSFDCDCANLSFYRITDSSYIVEKSGYTGCIYNLDRKSKCFKRIYDDKKVSKFFNDGTLLVSEEISATARNDISDTLTYGINPETFEITTPIWSEEQQRWINVYTREKVERLREELREKGLFLGREDLGEITIYFEVERYLNILAEKIDRPQCVYTDIMRSNVNKDFVKKFVKN